MNLNIIKSTILLIFLFCSTFIFPQQEIDSTKTYVITQNDGSQLTGKILKNDERELTVLLMDRRKIIIPQYVIKSITPVNSSDFNAIGQYVGEENFRTRYFLTTNGLPVKKGKNYVQWTLLGPDLQFSVTDRLGAGLMTTWIGMPIIGSVKYTGNISENVNYAVGALVGTGSYIRPTVGGALPFGAITFGDGRSNLNFSAGYGAIWNTGDVNGRPLVSVAGMTKVGKKVTLVLDSFFLLSTDSYNGYIGNRLNSTFGFIVPGIRINSTDTKAFQIGFASLYVANRFIPTPFPVIQWFRIL
jgi:hypothetical protein